MKCYAWLRKVNFRELWKQEFLQAERPLILHVNQPTSQSSETINAPY